MASAASASHVHKVQHSSMQADRSWHKCLISKFTETVPRTARRSFFFVPHYLLLQLAQGSWVKDSDVWYLQFSLKSFSFSPFHFLAPGQSEGTSRMPCPSLDGSLLSHGLFYIPMIDTNVHSSLLSWDRTALFYLPRLPWIYKTEEELVSTGLYSYFQYKMPGLCVALAESSYLCVCVCVCIPTCLCKITVCLVNFVIIFWSSKGVVTEEHFLPQPTF